MIPQQNRFNTRGQIDRVYKTSRPIRSGAFNIRVKVTKKENYRLAVVVSKKVSRSAVTRNRIRRRIFEYVRKNLAEKPSILGKDILITVFDESVAEEESKKLEPQLKKLFEKADI